jgi:predicted dehydrogenase
MLSRTKNRKKVCLIGSGEMAKVYAEVFIKIPQLSLSSVVSKNFNNAKIFAKKYNINVFKSLKEVKIYCEPEIIIVCITPIELKKIINELLIFKNSQIFLEKPIGINYTENKEIYKILKTKKNFYPLLNRRFYQSTIEAKRILNNNINQKRYIVINNYHNFLHASEYGFCGSNHKFWPYMNSIHLLDFLFIFGRSKISSVKKILDERFSDSIRILSHKIKFISGDIAVYNTHYNLEGFWSVTIHTKNETLELKPLEQLIRKKKGISKKILLSNIDTLHKPGIKNMTQNLILKKSNKNFFNLNLSHVKKLMRLINVIYKV